MSNSVGHSRVVDLPTVLDESKNPTIQTENVVHCQ